jgi:two-component system sensor histidine kinase RegB
MEISHPVERSFVVRLRWALVAGQLTAVAMAWWGLNLQTPLFPLLLITLVSAASNLWMSRQAAVSPGALRAIHVVDVVLLTALLALSGGPSNPFSTLYLVVVALAAVTHGRLWTGIISAVAAACFGLLFLLPSDNPHAHHGGGDAMRGHLLGMWVAFVTTAAVIASFVAGLSGRLRERERELVAERDRTARAQRLAALGTLAAGAAHELGSPLGAIAVAAEEAELRARRIGDASLVEDLAFMGAQVARCRTILADLSSGAGTPMGEPPERIEIGDLVRRACPDGAQVEVTGDALSAVTRLPVRTASRVIGSLIRNGLLAAPGERVEVCTKYRDRLVAISVRDEGPGMSAEILARVGEPFFTTRPPGQGMGLGLFLARGFAEALGGGLELESAPGRGTTATILLPIVEGA